MSHNGTDPRHERARVLREQGLTYDRVADRIGVNRSTVYRWLNPSYAEQNRKHCRDYKARNRQAMREYDATYGREHRGHCLTCGQLMGLWHSEDGECQSCRSFGREWRRRRIASLWHEGLTLKQIAADLDSTFNAVGVEMVHMRRDGWDLPYRYTTGKRAGRKFKRAA